MYMALLMHQKDRPFIWQNLSLHALILLALSLAITGNADRPLVSLRQKPLLSGSLLPANDQCSVDQRPAEHVELFPSRVAEVNGTALETALSVLQESGDAYLAVLFYAKRCPFSKLLRPVFDVISFLFPGIYHFAVEESAIRASELSRYGVHSFPALFLQNKTTRMRYYGPKTIEALGHFYNDATGLQPSSSSILQGIDLKKGIAAELVKNNSFMGISSLKKLLFHDDMYLTLATLFLVLRIFHYVIPKVISQLKRYCTQRINILHAAKAALRREARLLAEREQHIKKSKADKGKGIRTDIIIQGGAKISGGTFVQRWSSSSLAPVSLAGSSSSEGWENHRTRQGSF